LLAIHSFSIYNGAMKTLTALIPFVLVFLLVLPPTSIVVDSHYSAEINAALTYLEYSSPDTYRFVSENVKSIKVFSDARMNSGEAEYNPSGEIQIADYLFLHPELYFPNGDKTRHIAQLIVHEARHEWQFDHLWWLFMRNTPADRQFLEQDAVNFARPVCPECY
jgi:hypothetical protein